MPVDHVGSMLGLLHNMMKADMWSIGIILVTKVESNTIQANFDHI